MPSIVDLVRVIPIRRACLLLSLLCLAPVSISLADETIHPAEVEPDVVRATLAKCLRENWSATVAIRKETEEAIESIGGDLGHDRDSSFAIALLYIKQRKTADAERVLSRILAIDPNDLRSLQFLSWLSASKRNMEGALTHLKAITKSLPSTEKDEELRRDMITFCGQMLGYASGPGKDRRGAQMAIPIADKFRAKLEGKEQELFSESMQEVIERYTDYMEKRSETKEVTRIENDKSKEEALQEVAERKVALTERSEEIDKAKRETAEQLDEKQREYQNQDAPLATQGAAVAAQGDSAASSLAFIQSDIANLQRILARERDPIVRARLWRQIDFLNFQASSLYAELASVQRNLNIIGSQRANLAQRHQVATSTISGKLNRLDQEDVQLRRIDSQLDRKAKKAQKKTSDETSKTRSLLEKAQALSTYISLPLEGERLQILGNAE